jgi:acetyl-CoA synthetase
MLPRAQSYEESRRAFRWHIPEAFNAAVDSLDRQCRPGADLDRTALIARQTDGSTAHFSYGALKRLSDLLAAAFANLLVEPGATVATLLPQGAECALSALAALKAGASIAPMDTAWGPTALAAAMAVARPRVVVADRAAIKAARAAIARLDPAPALLAVGAPLDDAPDFWATLYAAPEAAVAVATAANDPAFLLFSQGRTGAPKAIRHAHRAILAHLPAIEMAFENLPSPGDLIWCAAPPSHPMGLISGLFAPWLLGIPVLAMGAPDTPASAEDRIARIARHGVRLALLTPGAIQALRQFPEPRAHYSFALRAAVCLGGRLPDRAHDWCRNDLGIPLGRLYGETETGPVAASHPQWFPTPDPNGLGRAVPGITLDVVDADGVPVALDGVGTLAVLRDYPGLCLGAEGGPSAVARWARRKYVGKWFLTDDIARIDENADIRFVAKADDILPHADSGFLPDDIERVLARHRMVADAAVLALETPDGNVEVVAAVVAKPDVPGGDAAAEALLAADILEQAAQSLAPYALPRRIVFVEAIPRTDEGRVHRARLRAALEA